MDIFTLFKEQNIGDEFTYTVYNLIYYKLVSKFFDVLVL